MVYQVDLAMSPSEDSRARFRVKPYVVKLKGKTNFTESELTRVLFLHYKLTRACPMGRSEFKGIMHSFFGIPNEDMIDRMFSIIDVPGTKGIPPMAWAMFLSMYTRSNLDERIDFAFNAYDHLSTGYISRDNMVRLLKATSLSKASGQDAEENANDLTDFLLKKMDLDKDGRLSLKDYKTSVLKNPMLLQIFGRVFPTRLILARFFALFSIDSSPLKFNKAMYTKKDLKAEEEKAKMARHHLRKHKGKLKK